LRRARIAGTALLAVGVAATAAIPAASGSTAHVTQAAKKPVKRTIKVYDYDFSRHKLTVPRRSRIVWTWPSAEAAGDQHNVSLKKRPKGVKHWESEIASSDYTYKRKLRKKGKYVVICELHEYMRTTIRVK
jgi:plastocyanin